MRNNFKIQVPKEHYSENYDHVRRFISYFYQIDLARSLIPKKTLEIGVGNKTVSNYLRQNGLSLDTCDFDKELEPDFVADIRDLPFEDASYDLIMSCEVLEHLPWKDLDGALQELHRVSRRYVLIGIPFSSIGLELIIKLPILNKMLNRPYWNIFFRIPHFYKGIKFSGQHYWEMGRKNYSRRKIRMVLRRYFKIKEEIRPLLDHQRYFFVLEKKD